MTEKQTRECIERYVNRIKRLYNEKYGVRVRFNIYYFPRYDKWIVTMDESYKKIDIHIQDFSHILQWKTRYLEKQGVSHYIPIILEESLPIELTHLENEFRKEQQRDKIKF